jgi:hypothetical protein
VGDQKSIFDLFSTDAVELDTASLLSWLVRPIGLDLAYQLGPRG